MPLKYYNITTPAATAKNNKPMQSDKCNHFIVKVHSYVQFPYEKDLPVHVWHYADPNRIDQYPFYTILKYT